ncbi:MAG: YceI family protein [Saprospiraceae bacterium]|nr:YceI family protein [Saprospiraceae bacterium]
MRFLIVIASILLFLPAIYAQTHRCDDGLVKLRSDAALEIIDAQSHHLKGAIDATNNTFAWSVEITSLKGFNSPLQKEHFNENYMESPKYPRASFSGKIIEKIDFEQNGTYTVRAKGQLSIHGITQERIIKSTLEIKNGELIVKSDFSVPLSDHNISIPKIVHQKIAEEINVNIEARLKQPRK